MSNEYNIGILNKNNYEKKTLDTYEVISAYFVDIYYNHLYIEAKKLKTNNSTTSITEGYKHALNAFLQGIENPKLYKKSLVGMHSFFISSGFSSITFSECIEKITQEFIPKDYYLTLSKQKKISVLKFIIGKSNKIFIEKIVRKFLIMIIDQHKEIDNIRVLQDEFMNILIYEREEMYHRFITTETKTTKGADFNIIKMEAMQNDIKNLCIDKYKLNTMITNLKKIIVNKENTLIEFKKQIENLNNVIAELNKPVPESNIFPSNNIENSSLFYQVARNQEKNDTSLLHNTKLNEKVPNTENTKTFNSINSSNATNATNNDISTNIIKETEIADDVYHSMLDTLTNKYNISVDNTTSENMNSAEMLDNITNNKSFDLDF